MSAVLRAQRSEWRGSAPGRVCPTSYRYSPRVFDREPEIVADTLYVVGGLYGNVQALDALVAMAERERATVVFNGDFHWFDVARNDFLAIEAGVAPHRRLRGNVETEIAADDPAAGCGCAYPLDVSDAEVSRSNAILERLREAARACIDRDALAALPMHLVARVGEARIGIVHGDAASLAGWGFAHDRLDDPAHRRWIESAFRDARVDAFASTHTCLPAFRDFGFGAVANNGSAGMPNFAGTDYGLVTRISRTGSPGRLFAVRAGDVHIEAIALRFDSPGWHERFLASWPAGSAAHASYYRRITAGPRFEPAQAEPIAPIPLSRANKS
jgi:hypothetical protein